jgi:hypothetical protein
MGPVGERFAKNATPVSLQQYIRRKADPCVLLI